MRDRIADEKMINELFELIVSLQTKEECETLFGDLCTMKELEQMAQRVKAAKLLLEGKTFKEVIEVCNISPTTLSRVSRCVQYGKGYVKFLG